MAMRYSILNQKTEYDIGQGLKAPCANNALHKSESFIEISRMIDIEMMINHFKAAISNRRMLCFNIIRQTLYNLTHKTIRLLVSFLLHAYWIAT